MFKIPYSFLFFICLLLILSCQQGEIPSPETDESTEMDRNMFGHNMPRGLILKNESDTSGFILFCIPLSASTYLMNRDGEVVHEWKGNYKNMGAYLQDDGTIVQNAHDPDFPVFAGGGETGRIQKIGWDSKMLWDFEYASEEYHAHHDFAVMPNGNILAIAWEYKSVEETLAVGRNPEMIPKAGSWPDKIVEIEPQGKYHGKIVWKWHVWDHLIQDYDPDLPNYGNPSDHPELLDINAGRPLPPPITQDSMDILHAKGGQWRNRTAYNRGSDIYHLNSINYNADLDQIVFSSPSLGELIIIDHSTTTKEAASHEGGRQGMGGDFLYRWGNPQNYGRGDSTDQQLFSQHDVRWIEEGKPGAGNLTVFNNDVPMGPDSMEYSAVYEISPPMDQNGNYILPDIKAFGPEKPTWTYIAPDTISFFSGFISGAHRMKNGNTLINEGAKGRFFEVNTNGEIVWEYWNPYRGNIRKLNGDPIPPRPMTFSQFRATFIPSYHPALDGRELTPLDPQPDVFVEPPPPSSE